MKYLVIVADYNSSGIKDKFEGELDRDDINLPETIWEELTDWVSKYQEIIPMDRKQRIKVREKIDELDKKGIALKQKIIDHCEGNAKVKYYSEGLLQYIP
jgi:hypothetical protein